MNIFELEQSRQKLIYELRYASSDRQSFFLIYLFYLQLYEISREVAEPYFLEFLDDFIKYSENFDPFHINPTVTRNIIGTIDDLSQRFNEHAEKLKHASKQKSARLENLEKILSGKPEAGKPISKIYFPVLEDHDFDLGGISLGMLESITVHLKKGNEADKFIIIPSDKKIEERIKEQIEISWQHALEKIRKQKKNLFPFHEIIIQFDKRAGIYHGDSLGVALNIAFIEQLFIFYNTPYTVSFKNNIVSTGSVDAKGKINSVSPEIIKKKIEIVFFSDIEIFAVPEKDLKYAKEKAEQLLNDYPSRNLKITGIEDLDDLYNRRNLVDIKKRPVINRAVKYSQKNWLVVSLLLILVLSAVSFSVYQYDDNPVKIKVDGVNIFFLNKSSRVLFSKVLVVPGIEHIKDDYVVLIDVNSDGINEAIITREFSEISEQASYGVNCYDNKGQKLWNFAFKETAESATQKIDSLYGIQLIDTLTENGIPYLYCYANNAYNFAGAIFRIDLRNGTYNKEVVWHAGHIIDGILHDVDKDGEKEIVAIGSNNGLRNSAFFIFEKNNFQGIFPTSPDYMLKNKNLNPYVYYMLIPKSDFIQYYKSFRSGCLRELSLSYNSLTKSFYFNSSDIIESREGMTFRISEDLSEIEITIMDRFRIRRDSLIAHGELKGPLTESVEFKNSIIDNILYWDGEKFVTKKEFNPEKRFFFSSNKNIK